MELDLTGILLDIEGKPEMSMGKPQTFGQCIGRNLFLQSGDKSIVHARWAQELFDTGKLELTMEEWVDLKKFIQSIGIGNGFKAQILNAISAQEKK